MRISPALVFLIPFWFASESFAQSGQDYELDFGLFVIALQMDDTSAAKTYFESDSAYHVNHWQIFEEEFVQAIAGYSYSQATDSWIAGEKVKELQVEYSFSGTDLEGNEFSGTTLIYVFFKETTSGLKMVECFRPEGSDAP